MTYVEVGKKLIEEINNLGYEAYFVGGFVRDFLMGLSFNDIDITTNADSDLLMNHFPNTFKRGLKYNSIVIVFEKFHFEVTTYRRDVAYLDNRHPQIKKALTLEEDLTRRDFTINAMAMDINNNIIDLFGGREDISFKMIRAIGDPSVRFKEDALRMLRACYFAAKLDFTIEDKTVLAIKESAELLLKISAERVYEELNKLVKQKYQKTGLKWIIECGLDKYIPGLTNGVKAYLNYNISYGDMRLFLACCFLEDKDGLNYYRISKKKKMYIEKIIEAVETFKKQDYSNYTLSYFGIDVCLKANMLCNKFGYSKVKNKDISARYTNIIDLQDKDIAISITQLNDIFMDWKITHKVFLEIKKSIMNKEIQNTSESILKYVSKK